MQFLRTTKIFNCLKILAPKTWALYAYLKASVPNKWWSSPQVTFFQKLSKAEGAKSKKNINNAFENKIF